MPWLIDGCNLMGFLPGLRHDRGGDRHELRRRLLRSPEVRRRGMTLVFDGEGEGGRSKESLAPGLEIHFSGARRDADTVIRALLNKASPNHFVLVTDDRELRDYARAMGFRNVNCAEFLRLTASGGGGEGAAEDREPEEKRSDRPLGRKEVDEWLDWFGNKDED